MEKNKKEEQEEVFDPVLENFRKLFVSLFAIAVVYKSVPIICDTYLTGVAMKHGLYNRRG